MDALKINAEAKTRVQLSDSRKTEEGVGEKTERRQAHYKASALAPTLTAGSFASLCFWVMSVYSQTASVVSDKAAKQGNSHLQRAKHHYSRVSSMLRLAADLQGHRMVCWDYRSMIEF